MRPDKNADLAQIALLADGHTAVAQNAVSRDAQPRPMKGIFVAMTVMNCTLASNGRLAM
jgi:hypothetical protein